MKNIEFFYLKIFIFLVVKFSVYLNRHVFVMFDDYSGIKFLFSIKRMLFLLIRSALLRHF